MEILNVNGFLLAQAEIPGSGKSSFSMKMMDYLSNVHFKVEAIRGKVHALQIISSYIEHAFTQVEQRATIICSSFIPKNEQVGISFSVHPYRSFQIHKYSQSFISDVIRQLSIKPSTPQCIRLVAVDSTSQRLRAKG